MTKVFKNHLILAISIALPMCFLSSLAPAQTQPAICDITKPTPDAEFVVLAARSGASLSSLALGPKSQITTVVDVELIESDRPLYLLLTASTQIIWNISGSRRIERVVSLSPTLKGSWSGVSGVPEEKVQFADANVCSTPYSTLASLKVGEVFGRQPDLKGSERDIERITIDRRVQVFTGKLPRRRDLRPQYYFQGVENTLFNTFPGGFRRLDDQAVVSDASVEAYDVAPSFAGLIELLREGKVSPASRDERSKWRNAFQQKYPSQIFSSNSRRGGNDYAYIINQPITLPAGLVTKFLLESGVPMPKGISKDFKGCVLVMDDFSAFPDKCNPFGGRLLEQIRVQETSLQSDSCRQTEIDGDVDSNLGLYAFLDRNQPPPKGVEPQVKVRLVRPGRHHIVLLGFGPRTAWEIETGPGAEIAGVFVIGQPSLTFSGLSRAAKIIFSKGEGSYQPQIPCTEYQVQTDPRSSGLHEKILDNSILAYTGRRLDGVVAATIGQETLID